jgi:hypothetical protein
MPSSVVRNISYEVSARRLRIVYVSGNAYDYFDVPEKVYEAMKLANSKGEFLNRQIKGHYGFVRVK